MKVAIPIVIKSKYIINSNALFTGCLKRTIDKAPIIPSDKAMFPVIVLSNLSSQTDIDKAFELGAVDYIVKSNYTPFEVMRTIQKHLPSK